jgi:single-strand DNA-binding protein
MVNKVILIGNLGKDPEARATTNSTVCSLSVGTSSKFKDKSGQYQEKTEWHRVVVWGKTAEFCGNYLQKGSKVYIEGRLETRKWDKNGVDQYTTEVIADTVQNLSPRNDGGKSERNTDQYQGTGEEVPF